MRPEVLKLARDTWQHHLELLDDALDESIRSLRNLLRLDNYHRHGHESEALQESLGPFGASSINVKALSQVLGQSERSLSGERRAHVESLLRELTALQDRYAEVPGEIPTISLSEPEERIEAETERHLNEMAHLFGTLRAAQLEIHSKYEAETHATFFDRFDWRQLNPTELSLCPPALVHTELPEDCQAELLKILTLLGSRKPVKVVTFRPSLRRSYPASADASVPAGLNLELLPVAMRGVFFLQGSLSMENFENRILEAMTAPRPTVISLLARRESESQEAFELRTERALASRAFPAIRYNPDQAAGFVACLDLSGNPPKEEALDYARFAANEPEFSADFSDPPEGTASADLIPVADFLSYTRRQRGGKQPCLKLDGQAPTKVLSANLLTQIADSGHVWKTLRELSGQDHPQVAATHTRLRREFDEEQKALLDARAAEWEEKARQRETMAVATAVKRIVATFAEVDPGTIDLREVLAAASIPDQPDSNSNG
jgi:hypothetical protein